MYAIPAAPLALFRWTPASKCLDENDVSLILCSAKYLSTGRISSTIVNYGIALSTNLVEDMSRSCTRMANVTQGEILPAVTS